MTQQPILDPMLLATCKVDPTDITVKELESSSRTSSPELEASIETIWQERLADAKAQGKKLWNSVSYRLESFRLEDERLTLELSTVQYSELSALRTLIPERKLGEGYWPKFLFVAGMVRTSDGKYVFGRGGNRYTDHDYDLLGGIVAKSEGVIRDGLDLAAVLTQELEEEANITPESIASLSLGAIFISPWYGAGLAFNVQLDVSQDDVQRRFDTKNDGEMASLVFVDQDDISDYLESLGGYKPLLRGMTE